MMRGRPSPRTLARRARRRRSAHLSPGKVYLPAGRNSFAVPRNLSLLGQGRSSRRLIRPTRRPPARRLRMSIRLGAGRAGATNPRAKQVPSKSGKGGEADLSQSFGAEDARVSAVEHQLGAAFGGGRADAHAAAGEADREVDV